MRPCVQSPERKKERKNFHPMSLVSFHSHHLFLSLSAVLCLDCPLCPPPAILFSLHYRRELCGSRSSVFQIQERVGAEKPSTICGAISSIPAPLPFLSSSFSSLLPLTGWDCERGSLVAQADLTLIVQQRVMMNFNLSVSTSKMLDLQVCATESGLGDWQALYQLC